MAYEGFGRDVNTISIDSLDSAEKLLRKSLNIGFEWSILVEAQHVIDELQIMQEIFTQQIIVLKDFEKALKSISESATVKDREVRPDERHWTMRTLNRVSELMSDTEQRRNNLAEMEKLQTKTRAQVSGPFSTNVAVVSC